MKIAKSKISINEFSTQVDSIDLSNQVIAKNYINQIVKIAKFNIVRIFNIPIKGIEYLKNIVLIKKFFKNLFKDYG